MANMLDKYADAADEAVVSASVPIDDDQQRALKEKELKALKKLTKALRKSNELMEQEAARRKAEKESAERESTNGVKGFFRKLGDAVCKAVPKVLTTLATLAFGYFFKVKSSERAVRAA